MALDPVLVLIAVATMAIIFLVGAYQKLRDLAAFEAAVEAYELTPAILIKPVAYALPMAEASAAVLLCIEPGRHAGAALAALVLLVVTLAVAINLLRGRSDVGCGCGGPEDEQPISWALVARNVILAGGIAAAAMTPAARALVWLDYFSVVAGALALYGLYVAGNQLIANRPRLISLRERA